MKKHYFLWTFEKLCGIVLCIQRQALTYFLNKVAYLAEKPIHIDLWMGFLFCICKQSENFAVKTP